MSDIKEKYCLTVCVINTSGALSRVIGVFLRKGLNIDSLSVSRVNLKSNVSKISILTSLDSKMAGRVTDILEKDVCVYNVTIDIYKEEDVLNAQLALFKIEKNKLWEEKQETFFKKYRIDIKYEDEKVIIISYSSYGKEILDFINYLDSNFVILSRNISGNIVINKTDKKDWFE